MDWGAGTAMNFSHLVISLPANMDQFLLWSQLLLLWAAAHYCPLWRYLDGACAWLALGTRVALTMIVLPILIGWDSTGRILVVSATVLLSIMLLVLRRCA